MNTTDIQKLARQGESEKLEFKLGSVAPSSVARVICSFLNTGGGRIVVGVDDQGEFVGVKDAPDTASRIEMEVRKLISPTALWDMQVVGVGDDREIVIFEVPDGPDKPYVVEGAIYTRKGEKTVPATRDQITDLIQSRTRESERWERQVALGAARDDLRDDLVTETLKRATDAQRWHGSVTDLDAFLLSLGLLINGSITNAALILFGKEPTRFLPQARVRLLVSPEGKTGDVYTVDRTFDSCLLENSRTIPEALATYTAGVESRFDDDWQRTERVLYPTSAIREGVMNALVHRDYSLNGSIMMVVRPNSFEISNPGSLPSELKPADLKKDHLSLPRNPDIAHVCFLYGLIEKVGRGTQRIVEVCRQARLKDPRWQSTRSSTTLTLFSRSAALSISSQLGERQELILKTVREHGTMKTPELVKVLGVAISDRTIRADLEQLVGLGLLIRRGRGRSTSYRSSESPT